jgi:hypothetical protein
MPTLLSLRTWSATQLRLWFEFSHMVALGRSLARRVMPAVSTVVWVRGFLSYSDL